MSQSIANWSRTHHCTPARLERPRSEDTIIALVKNAADNGDTIRVIGALHSWSDCAMSDGIVVSLDDMQQVLEVDRDGLRVRVQAGIRLARLNEELAAVGLALPIVGSVVEQSIAGVMSTGTHGSSLTHGNIPSAVVGMRLVTGKGDVLVLDEDHELLPAARVALGALGVITEVTLSVQPAFRLCETTETIPFDDAVRDMEAIARSAEYVKLWWLPHTDAVIVFRSERTTEPGRISPVVRWIDEHIVNQLLFATVLWLGRWFNGLIAPLNRLVARTYLKPRRVVGRSDKVMSLAMPPRHREMEYSVPMTKAGEALRQTRALIGSHNLRVNFITEVRFVRGDDAWLSPATARDSCQLGAYMAESEGIERYFGAFQGAMKALGGRPHWGKEFQANVAELSGQYPEFERFVALARRLDPKQIFRNRFVARLFESTEEEIH
ncbi:MAG: FAD-binding protein [Myxococcales bacterium]|nr:FAD-binding protein [Myxococcales bacterium]